MQTLNYIGKEKVSYLLLCYLRGRVEVYRNVQRSLFLAVLLAGVRGGGGEVATPATANRVVIFACFTHFCLCSKFKH